ncbi:MAG TPA: DsrE family protein [Candidatus Lokiarchaeia archaeon]|nr:DsrE family protein [Candidatus Lokiarchaeia archaeon]
MQSVVIVCDQAPIGTNSAAEVIRIGSGLAALGDSVACKVIFMGDAVYLLAKRLNPPAVNQDAVAEVLEMANLSDLPIYVQDESLAVAGLTRDDLADMGSLAVATTEEIAKFLEEADACFRY